MDDVIDFANDLLKTPPDDLDRRIGKMSPEMLKQIAKNIVIQYQNLQHLARKRKTEREKLAFYAEKLEKLLMRSAGGKELDSIDKPRMNG